MINKEEAIEDMAQALKKDEEYADIYGNTVDHTTTAENPLNAGYGNIKKAVTEFVNRLMEKSTIACIPYATNNSYSLVAPFEVQLINIDCVKVSTIQETLKEFLECDR
ncbi:MAG: hypothetical protein J1E81_05995 [Eubacterium sp.]|nr:hypothetical protein [Eubacterium sp.]